MKLAFFDEEMGLIEELIGDSLPIPRKGDSVDINGWTGKVIDFNYIYKVDGTVNVHVMLVPVEVHS